ncbi:hypothetical protein CIPAW_09G082400 [Carya illinoinensis]|uniref:Uncharacterized protein n=1 Tax=Carya illinoinensis TaxID=32201 RepID=A0A8T1PKH3_CARIL|nr:hypothetical protein CIPAW_09G082400 [Carya illinoinensis]
MISSSYQKLKYFAQIPTPSSSTTVVAYHLQFK